MQRRSSARLFHLPHVALPLCRRAKDRRPRDVRRIPLDRAPGVHEHDVAVAQRLRLDASVRKGRVLAKDHQRAIGVSAECRGGLGDMRSQLMRRHPFFQGPERFANRLERDVVRPLHQRDLGRRLEHSATGSDGRGADEPRPWKLLAHAVVDEEAHPLLHADRVTRRRPDRA